MRVQRACAARLADATYAAATEDCHGHCLRDTRAAGRRAALRPHRDADRRASVRQRGRARRERIVPFDDDWDDLGGVVRRAPDGTIVIDAGAQRGPGSRARPREPGALRCGRPRVRGLPRARRVPAREGASGRRRRPVEQLLSPARRRAARLPGASQPCVPAVRIAAPAPGRASGWPAAAACSRCGATTGCCTACATRR